MNRSPVLASMFILLVIMALAQASPVHAAVDLLNPLDGAITNATNISFDYYASMPGMTNCSIIVNGNVFVDNDLQNGMNNVLIQAMAPGIYSWNASCTDGTALQTSATRNLTIDTQPPTVVIASPLDGSTLSAVAVDFVPYDDMSSALTCRVRWNAALLEDATVAAGTHYVKSYSLTQAGSIGNGTLSVDCEDRAGNTAHQERNLLYQPDFGLQLSTSKTSYGISEPVLLTVNTLSGANVTVDICPDQAGFVQCSTAIFGSNSYPQNFTLPYMNRTGSYLVEGTAQYGGQTRTNRTRYNITNTMGVHIAASRTPYYNVSFNLTATPSGGIAPYRVLWQLANGTPVADRSSVEISLPPVGTFSQRVFVTDAANNTAQESYNYTIDPLIGITLRVTDNRTNAAIANADISLDGDTDSVLSVKTGADGLAYLYVSPGGYKFMASAFGYRYALSDIIVNAAGNPVYGLSLEPDVAKPAVTIVSPTQGSDAGSPVAVQFNVKYQGTVTCTLYTSSDGNWFAPNATLNVSDAADKAISVPFDQGQYRIRIDCADTAIHSRSGTSAIVGFNVSNAGTPPPGASPAGASPTAPSADELKLQDAIDGFDQLLQGLDSYGPKEKDAIAILGYDRQLRNAKRAVQQAVRDLNDLQYRQEYDDAARVAEHKRIVDSVSTLLAETPRGIAVKDSKSFVRYLREDEAAGVATALAGLGGLSADPSVISKRLMGDQQKFTISTKAYQVDYLYADGTSKQMTMIARSFTYAKNISPDYAVYEIVPKEVAKSAKELDILTKAEVLKDDPVLRFAAGDTMTYVVPKRIDFTRIEDIKTVLSRPYVGETGMLTGFAVFGAGDMAGVGTPVIVLVVLIVLAYLVYYFDLVKHAQFLLYRMGKKSKLHYVRVLINDANDNLEAGNYEKASMLYKEIRLTYDTMPLFAKNELYEDIAALLAKMDGYYFNLVMIELDGHMKAGDLDSAIQSYEKLTGIYARLDKAQQDTLVATITALGRRVGAGVRT